VARKAIFGLGNPGPRYAATRHNVGFMVLDLLARRHAIPLDRGGALAAWGEGRIAGIDALLAEPLGFMNRSGEAVRVLLPPEVAPATDLLVVHDEIDLPFGRLKLKRGGGTAGHRGLSSIGDELGELGFCRLRVGVGRPAPGQEAAEHVLSPFASEEADGLRDLCARAVDACEAWIELPIDVAMNRVNAPAAPPADAPAAPDSSDP
jgi:peptidyl-tRNA hydrolase, PTH1 family